MSVENPDTAAAEQQPSAQAGPPPQQPSVKAAVPSKQPSQYVKAVMASDRFCRYKKTYYLSTVLLLFLVALFVFLAWRLLFGQNGGGGGTGGTAAAPADGTTANPAAAGAPNVSVAELVAGL